MVASPAVAMPFAVMTVFACAETAAAKARPRHPAAHHSVVSSGQAVLRKRPPVSQTPAQDEKAWMERASAPTSSGPGGGM
jgi:hypothetical protein